MKKMKMMKLRSISAIIRDVKDIDPDTALTNRAINEMIDRGIITTTCSEGIQRRMCFEKFQSEINEYLKLDNTHFPKLRTIPSAISYAKEQKIGFGKGHVRFCIKKNFVTSIEAGNRRLIALEEFEEPYIERFMPSMPSPKIPCPQVIAEINHEESNVRRRTASVTASLIKLELKRKSSKERRSNI